LRLLNRPDDLVRVVAGESLAGVDDLDAAFPEQVAVVASLVVVDPAKPLDVIDQNRAEVAVVVAGVGDQALEAGAVVGTGAGDRIVGV
jgi:hypothetical protein